MHGHSYSPVRRSRSRRRAISKASKRASALPSAAISSRRDGLKFKSVDYGVIVGAGLAFDVDGRTSASACDTTTVSREIDDQSGDQAPRDLAHGDVRISVDEITPEGRYSNVSAIPSNCRRDGAGDPRDDLSQRSGTRRAARSRGRRRSRDVGRHARARPNARHRLHDVRRHVDVRRSLARPHVDRVRPPRPRLSNAGGRRRGHGAHAEQRRRAQLPAAHLARRKDDRVHHRSSRPIQSVGR